MAGNMWDDAAAEEPEEEITLRLLQVVAAPGDNPSWMRVQLKTSRGDIDGVLHPVEGGTSAVICVGGAMGGLDGPAGKLYPRLAGLLAAHLVTTLRLNYRKPNETAECVADVLAGCSFLKGIGGTEVVLVGHSFGAAVVIKAGELAPIVRGVVSMSPQLFGTREVHNLGKPLLLVHGTADSVLSHEASEDIYRRAEEPKRIVLFADTGHSLIQAKAKIDVLLEEWIPACLSGQPLSSGRSEYVV